MEISFIERADAWINGGFDEETKREIISLKENNLKELEDCFYRNLEFGTGGLRGVMGPGTNRMNKYTVGMATQGLANYIRDSFPGRERLSVAIAYDSRNFSTFFAEVTAGVFCANGIDVFMYSELRPTPQLSFTIRDLKCVAGVMITASHNPKEYNGYKVYWEDGAQITAPHDSNIISEVEKITDPSQVNFTGGSGKLHLLGEDEDKRYLDAILSLMLSPEEVAKHNDFKIVFTPLHGTGITMVPKALKRLGFINLITVPEQSVPDGNFPTVKSPNPEESSALKMALDIAAASNADLVMATDPDADRLGIAIRDDKGEMVLLNGNQTAALLTYYILSRRKELGLLNEKCYMVKTIVTTDLLKSIASAFGVEMFEVLTGFKYIAEVVRELEGNREFIGGGEESYGFNVGEYVRDKDAVVSCALFAEAAAWAASKNRSLWGILRDIYLHYGFYKESLLSLTKKGKDGMEQINRIMSDLRRKPIESIDGSPVVLIKDYKSGECVDMISDLRYDLKFPKSNVLQFVSSDNTIVSVRPSGTEPKIKFYFGVKMDVGCCKDLDEVEAALDQKINRITAAFSSL